MKTKPITPAGKQFICEQLAESNNPPDYGHMTAAVEFGIRIFCEELERRAGRWSSPEKLFGAYEEFRQELFG